MRHAHVLTAAALLAFAPQLRSQGNPTPAPTATTGKSEIIGVVVDSLHRRYLAGADVQVAGLSTDLQTDSLGRFTIHNVPPGTYQVGIFHALLDTLDLTLLTQPFHVGPDSAGVVVLAVPSAATIIHRICPSGADPLASAVVGHVTNPETLAPIDHAEVTVTWVEFEVSKSVGIRRTPHLVRDSTDSSGAFRICGLPGSLNASLQARRGAAITGEIPIALGDTPPQVFARTLSLVPAESAANSGNATVSGVVVLQGAASNEGSRLELTGTDIVAVTDAKGEFTMRNLPSGSKLLIARHLGFSAEAVPVDLSSHAPQRVEIKLAKFVAVMDPVLVTARRTAALDRVGFSQRQRSGFGHFIGPDRLARIHAYQVTDILRLVPGLRIIYSPQGETVASTRGGSIMGGSCVQYFVDDIPWTSITPGDVNHFVSGNEVVAVEVYQGAGTPAEYQRGGNACTTIVLWTRFKIRG